MGPKGTVLVCGDSVLDNAAYVGMSGRSVKSHLGELLEDSSADWRIDFRAVDGAVCADVSTAQLREAPGGCDAVVLSVGGNDALGNLHLLEDPSEGRLIDFALVLADIQDGFRSSYRGVLDAAEGQAQELLALTIYRPRFHLDGMPPELQRAAEALLSIFNDVIQEETHARGHHLLDLRHICVSDEHFANPIEPSDLGGREIALAISQWLEGLARDREAGRTSRGR